MQFLRSCFLLAPLAASACLEPDDAIDVATQPIHGDGAGLASQWQRDRAIAIPGCTATRISAQWALTAAHCTPDVGSTVYFYTTGPGRNTARSAQIAQVVYPPGVSGAECHDELGEACENSSGIFADLALIRLVNTAAAVDALVGPQAVLAWNYPGDGGEVHQVGAGAHDGVSNPTRVLEQIGDTLDGGDSDGQFDTDTDQVDGGDSGGPAYSNSRILGVAHGHGQTGLDTFSRYTSVPRNLHWILSQIGYAWRGVPPIVNAKYSGTSIGEVTGQSSERVCQYACEHTDACDAYNYRPATQQCELIGNVTTVASTSGWRAGLRFGASSAVSNTVAGYVRSDGVNVVVHRGTDGNVHELAHGAGAWSWAGISWNSPPAIASTSRLSAYRRADGTNAVVYRSTGNRIIELALVTSGWEAADLSSWGGATPAGDPAAYVRADGTSAVVYRATNNHIIELRLASTGWIATDLSAAAPGGINGLASSDPHAYVRSDGYSAVVYRSGTAIWELYQNAFGSWAVGVPSSFDGAPAASNRPFGYTHRDGTNAIVYRSTGGRLIELFIGGSGWTWSDVMTLAGTNTPVAGNPVAYVRTDAIESIVYRSSSNEIIELANAPWGAWNLTSQSSGWASTTDPAVYVRSDGYNAVVHGVAANHVAEIALRIGDAQWVSGDLSALANETP